jgi:hypothetical protein
VVARILFVHGNPLDPRVFSQLLGQGFVWDHV